jgi:hypothetical protein
LRWVIWRTELRDRLREQIRKIVAPTAIARNKS